MLTKQKTGFMFFCRCYFRFKV